MEKAISLLADLERRAAAIGSTLSKVCADAGVAVSTLRRWRKGITRPTESTYELLVNEINGKRGASRPKRKKAA